MVARVFGVVGAVCSSELVVGVVMCVGAAKRGHEPYEDAMKIISIC